MDSGGCGRRECRAGNKTVLSIEQAFGLTTFGLLDRGQFDLSFKSLTGVGLYCSYSKLRARLICCFGVYPRQAEIKTTALARAGANTNIAPHAFN